MQLEVQKRKVEVQEKNKEWQTEMKIMETDTTGMDPISAAYWNNLNMEIMKKKGFTFQSLFIMLLLFMKNYVLSLIVMKVLVKLKYNLKLKMELKIQLEIKIEKIIIHYGVPTNAR